MIRNLVPSETLHMFYHIIIYSRLQYEILIWKNTVKMHLHERNIRLNNSICINL